MRDNGSPDASFETDEDRNYFLTTIPIHPALKPSEKPKSTQLPMKSALLTPESAQLIEKSTQLNMSEYPEALQKKLKSLGSRPCKEELRKIIIELCSVRPLSALELALIFGKKSKKALVRDHLTPLKQEGKLHIDNPKEHAANQKYRS